MIHVDHESSSRTVAERPGAVQRRSGDPAHPVVTQAYTTSKRAAELQTGDAIAVNFRGWGTLVMKVLWRAYPEEDDPRVVIDLEGGGEFWTEEAQADDRFVLYPQTLVGKWL
jgi:hypothetical protein